MREQDRLILNELHPADAASLRRRFAGDDQTKVLELDAWTALKSTLPPPERRGVVLIDPPFEVRDEFERIVRGLVAATRRFATGVFVIWYPIKEPAEVHRFKQLLCETALKRVMSAEIGMGQGKPKQSERGSLTGSGLIIHNPPFGLADTLRKLLPEVAAAMSPIPGSWARIDVLRGE